MSIDQRIQDYTRAVLGRVGNPNQEIVFADVTALFGAIPAPGALFGTEMFVAARGGLIATPALWSGVIIHTNAPGGAVITNLAFDPNRMTDPETITCFQAIADPANGVVNSNWGGRMFEPIKQDAAGVKFPDPGDSFEVMVTDFSNAALPSTTVDRQNIFDVTAAQNSWDTEFYVPPGNEGLMLIPSAQNRAIFLNLTARLLPFIPPWQVTTRT